MDAGDGLQGGDEVLDVAGVDGLLAQVLEVEGPGDEGDHVVLDLDAGAGGGVPGALDDLVEALAGRRRLLRAGRLLLCAHPVSASLRVCLGCPVTGNVPAD